MDYPWPLLSVLVPGKLLWIVLVPLYLVNSFHPSGFFLILPSFFLPLMLAPPPGPFKPFNSEGQQTGRAEAMEEN
jgi:hypothetical protein